MNRARTGVGTGIAAGAIALLAPLAAHAASMDYIDAYYIPDSVLEIDGPDQDGAIESKDGDGFGVKLALMLGENFFFAAAYDATENENIGGPDLQGTVDTSRIGFGYTAPGLPVYGMLEYVDVDYGFAAGADSGTVDENGFAAHVGLKLELIDLLTLEARGGYVDVGDYDGFEYLGGLAIALDRNLALFADYHVVDVENADSVSLKTSNVRAGLRFNFGTGGE